MTLPCSMFANLFLVLKCQSIAPRIHCFWRKPCAVIYEFILRPVHDYFPGREHKDTRTIWATCWSQCSEKFFCDVLMVLCFNLFILPPACSTPWNVNVCVDDILCKFHDMHMHYESSFDWTCDTPFSAAFQFPTSSFFDAHTQQDMI